MNLPARQLEESHEPNRVLPQNLDAEEALLGAILINNNAFYRVSDFLDASHFSEQINGKIFEIVGQLIRAGKTATPTTVKTFFQEDLRVGDLNSAQYLARLAAGATTIINAADYGRVIYDLHLRRSLIAIGSDVVNIAYDAPVDMEPSAQIEDAERRLFELAERGRFEGGFATFEKTLAQAIDMAAAAYKRDGHLSGIATGFRDIDKLMGGLQPSDLIIVAGRPGMGKTSLATNIAYNVAAAWRGETQEDGSVKTVDGGIVGFFSLEMSGEQLATRIVSEQTEVPSNIIRRGKISDQDFAKLVEFSRMMEKQPLYIDQTGGLSIGQLAARARRLKRQKGLDLLVIDYIQLLQSSNRRGDSRVQEVTEITNGLKALAKELNVPILAVSQLSRQVEMREDKRPQLSDLRESGSIEQDADIVMFIFREEYYLRNRKPKDNTEEYVKWERELKDKENRAEVIVAKHRHGPTDTIGLVFHGKYTRFSDAAPDHAEAGQDYYLED